MTPSSGNNSLKDLPEISTTGIQWLGINLIVQIKAHKLPGVVIPPDPLLASCSCPPGRWVNIRETGVYHFTQEGGGHSELGITNVSKWNQLPNIMCLYAHFTRWNTLFNEHTEYGRRYKKQKLRSCYVHYPFYPKIVASNRENTIRSVSLGWYNHHLYNTLLITITMLIRSAPQFLTTMDFFLLLL